ncbi:MAG: hypothetical protein RL319_956 [Actinomycetota bacterium]|jgi:hypothetical protein
MSSSTTLATFLKFSSDLKASLEANSDVLGLVLVGSTADTSRVDEWSDHDFFVVTKTGAAEGYRRDLSWLPQSEEIVMSPRETDHGLKVVYSNGHVLEFAVFDNEELELASANTYEVTIDRSDIGVRMQAIAEQSKPKIVDFEVEFEIFLGHILIGVGRDRRGEHLIAGQFARGMCLSSVLGLIRVSKSPLPGSEHKEDNLNRYRRFEQQYPNYASQLNEILQNSVEECFRDLFEFVLRVLRDELSPRQLTQADIVKQRFGWT